MNNSSGPDVLQGSLLAFQTSDLVKDSNKEKDDEEGTSFIQGVRRPDTGQAEGSSLVDR